ncbi:hypothetical protein ACFQ6V_23635 [Streptomyces roseifaciens]
MTDRIRLDDLTDNGLDQLYDELDAAQAAITRTHDLANYWAALGDPITDAAAKELRTALAAAQQPTASTS